MRFYISLKEFVSSICLMNELWVCDIVFIKQFNKWHDFYASWYKIKCCSEKKGYLKAIYLGLFQIIHSVNIGITYKNELDIFIWKVIM